MCSIKFHRKIKINKKLPPQSLYEQTQSVTQAIELVGWTPSSSYEAPLLLESSKLTWSLILWTVNVMVTTSTSYLIKWFCSWVETATTSPFSASGKSWKYLVLLSWLIDHNLTSKNMVVFPCGMFGQSLQDGQPLQQFNFWRVTVCTYVWPKFKSRMPWSNWYACLYACNVFPQRTTQLKISCTLVTANGLIQISTHMYADIIH